MKFDCNAVLLGSEERVSSKGNAYTVVLLQQGADTLNMMISEDIKISEYEVYKPYKFELRFDTRWKRFDCVGIGKVN